MKIQGNLATYEFSDLLQWLAQGNKTGLLTVTDGGVEYQLGFDHGRIDMSSSSEPEQRLDNYLFGKGVIDQATLARAERLREATKMMSGQVLVTLGAVTEMQLAQALRDKTEEILCELLTWDQGTFEFEGGDRPESTMVPISLEVTKLLLESMHRLDQRRSGEPAPPPQPSAEFMVAEPTQPVTPADATQAIEGLALAEVMDPESPPEVVSEMPSEDLPPHYAVMAQSPGQIRRLAPFVLVVLFSLTAGGFYLADRQASAQPAGAEPAGEAILFTQTHGPIPPRVETGAEETSPASVAVTAPAAVDPRADELALRRRYEQELAGLRKELEETRRLVQPVARDESAPAGRGSVAELPADSVMRAAISRPEPASTAGPTPLSRPSAPQTPEASATRPVTAPVASAPEGSPQEPPMAVAEPSSLPETSVRTVAPLKLANPKLVNRPAPRYPVAAQRHGRGAVVTVRVLVGTTGRVDEIERVGPKAGMGFDRAAEDAAMASTWEPGTRGDEPTAMWAELRFEFKP